MLRETFDIQDDPNAVAIVLTKANPNPQMNQPLLEVD
jgi:hypothetical protein